MATASDNGLSNGASPTHSAQVGGGQETMVVLRGGGRPMTVIQKSDSDDSKNSTPSNSAKNSPAHSAQVRPPVIKPAPPVIRPDVAIRGGKASEDQVELRRLRTECRLQQQRIDNLEKEMTTMGKRLIQKQAKITKQEDELTTLRSSLGLLSPTSPNASFAKSLTPTTDTPATSSADSVPEQLAASAAARCDKEENVIRLRRRIAELDQREIDACDTIRQLNEKIAELEALNEQLSEPVSVELLSIQDELVACKLREAESNLALKELQQNVARLEKHWQQFLDDKQLSESQQTAASSSSSSMSHTEQQLRELVMALRLRETHLVCELNDIKQKLMELETQNHIYERQTKRQDQEIGELREKLFRGGQQEDELNSIRKELQRNIGDLQTKCKEEAVMVKIREAEYSQSAAVMRRRIAELEIENQELRTSAELQNRESYLKEMEQRIQSLHGELRNLAQTNSAMTGSDGSNNHNEFSDDMTASFYNDLQIFSNPLSFDFLSTPPSFSDVIAGDDPLEEPHTPTPYSSLDQRRLDSDNQSDRELGIEGQSDMNCGSREMS